MIRFQDEEEDLIYIKLYGRTLINDARKDFGSHSVVSPSLLGAL
jgi:hypothetical protein